MIVDLPESTSQLLHRTNITSVAFLAGEGEGVHLLLKHLGLVEGAREAVYEKTVHPAGVHRLLQQACARRTVGRRMRAAAVVWGMSMLGRMGS